MYTHFRDSLANWLTITEIALFGRTDAMEDTRSSCFVIQLGQPDIKYLGTQKSVYGTVYQIGYKRQNT